MVFLYKNETERKHKKCGIRSAKFGIAEEIKKAPSGNHIKNRKILVKNEIVCYNDFINETNVKRFL